MKMIIDDLIKWLDTLSTLSLPEWEQLPEMELYMDQVMSYMEKKLKPLTNGNFDKFLTPFMINNYVKSGLLNSPNQKKYSRDQIGYIFGICSVKQILSISDIAMVFEMDKNISKEKNKVYNYFKEIQDKTLHDVETEINSRVHIVQKKHSKDLERNIDNNIQKTEKADEFARSNLALVAFKLAIEAEIKKIIADKILSSIAKSTSEDIAVAPATNKKVKS